ncbi:hypothetical protein EI555_005822, partial [Monodon monoceros]
MVPAGRGCRREESSPQKDGNALVAPFAPEGDVTSGAEEVEWCSEGQTKGGAGGAQRLAAGQSGRGSGLPAGRPCAAGPGRQLPWSKRNARTLPRQTWASLSTDSQLADSRAFRRVRTGPPPSRPAEQ